MKSYRLKEGLSSNRAKLRVREAPNFDSNVIAMLEQGETMRMRELGHDWMVVCLDDEAVQGFCKFSEDSQQLLEEVDEERELMRNQAISPLRASMDNIVVVQRSSPGGSTTSDSVSGSEAYVYYISQEGLVDAGRKSIDASSPLSSPDKARGHRAVSWGALPGPPGPGSPSGGLYLSESDFGDDEEYSSDSDEVPARTGWTPLRREGKKFSGTVFTVIDTMLVLLSTWLVYALQLVVALFLVLVVTVSLLMLFVTLRGLKDEGCSSWTVDEVRIAS